MHLAVRACNAGVERVSASPGTGLVVVDGTADAMVLRRRIEHKMRRPVTIMRDGTEDLPPEPDHHYYGMRHLAPPQYAPQPAVHPTYYTWGTTTPYPHHRYPPQPVGYYGGNHWPSYPRRYVPNGTPAYLDDEMPDGCCTVQ